MLRHALESYNVFMRIWRRTRAVWPIPVFLEALCLKSGEVWPV